MIEHTVIYFPGLVVDVVDALVFVAMTIIHTIFLKLSNYN